MAADSIQRLYDEKIADHYDRDRFGLLSSSRMTAIEQIQRQVDKVPVESVLDFALGTGTTMRALNAMLPRAKLSGIDISSKMLKQARERLTVRTFHDDVRNIDTHVRPDSQDLILIHFLFAYVEPSFLLNAARRLSRRGALVSIATTTYQSFPDLQTLAGKYVARDELQAAKVPRDPNALKSLLSDSGFDVLQCESIQRPLRFETWNDAMRWGTDSGWLTGYLAKLKPETVELISSNPRLFPVEDEFKAVIVLARRT